MSKTSVFLCLWKKKKSDPSSLILLLSLLCSLHRHTHAYSRVYSWYKTDQGQATTGCAIIISIRKETKMNYPVDLLVYMEKLTIIITVIILVLRWAHCSNFIQK